ncbi:hypothetical protein AGLY_015696 [Aphis glycines]|uniref:Uncharacterized protein n=1 Tax=Aphis glycines TaxID=307491 RepID=A0A6G0T080_APHGL|nr:hypothetical protein AGLY_015696 [Aphis glycines]
MITTVYSDVSSQLEKTQSVVTGKNYKSSCHRYLKISFNFQNMYFAYFKAIYRHLKYLFLFSLVFFINFDKNFEMLMSSYTKTEVLLLLICRRHKNSVVFDEFLKKIERNIIANNYNVHIKLNIVGRKSKNGFTRRLTKPLCGHVRVHLCEIDSTKRNLELTLNTVVSKSRSRDKHD